MGDQSGLELFSYWRTSAAYRVRVALALKGLSATERVIDLDAGEQRSPAFLAINPLGAIPALIDHDAEGPGATPLTQSLAILELLDETHPTPPLLPPDAVARAQVRSLALMLASDTHPLIVSRVKGYLTGTGGFDDASWRAWQTHWFTTGLQAVERRLAGEAATGTFCHGEQVTTADICLASIIVVMRVFRIEVDAIPTVSRIMAACERIEAFQRAEPRRQTGAPAG